MNNKISNYNHNFKLSDNKILDEKIGQNISRYMIFGSTGSGKSFMLAFKLLPKIKKKYQIIVVFTREYNRSFFNKVFKHGYKNIQHKIYTNVPNIMDTMTKIINSQKRNIKKYDKYGSVIYNDNILVILDDIINEKILKTDKFLELFVNMRHLQISVILVSQIINKAITPQLKSNTDYFIMFRLNSNIQRRPIYTMISDCILSKDFDISDKKAYSNAKKLYFDKVCKQKYSYIVIDKELNLFSG